MQDAILFLPEGEMKLKEEDRKWFTREIERQIKEVVDTLKPRGWRKLVHILRQLGPIIGTCSFVLAVMAIAVVLGIRVSTDMKEDGTFRGTTEQKLKNIESSLAEIKEALIKQSIATHAALPLADFKATLSELGSSIATARKQNLKVPSKVVDDLARKMAAINTDAPNFWPVAGELISYHSSLLVGNARNWSMTFPPCPGTVDMLGADKNATVQLSERGKPVGPKMPIQRIGNQNCYIELDGKKASRWDCKQCLVKYSGGPLSLTDVHFEDCLFVFDFRSKPALPDGERLVKSLLASKSQNVNFAAS